MKRNFTVIVALLTLALGFSSCEKEKEVEPSKASLLVGKNWRMTAVTVNGRDDMSSYESCELDNILTFTSDGKYKEVEGASKCDPSDPDVYEEGTFSINGDKITIREKTSAASFTADIKQLDSKTFKISMVDPFFGTGQVYESTYTAQ